MAPVRLEKNAFNDMAANIAGPQVFDSGHGVAAALDCDAGVDDRASVGIGTRFMQGRYSGGSLDLNILHHDLDLSG